MKVIKLKAFQSSANYKMPGSHQLKETFPLPPYSTVIGMVHKVAGLKEYVPMNISIQGEHNRVIDDAFTRYEFKNGGKYEKDRHNIKIKTEEGNYGITRGMGHAQLLIDVTLIIHVMIEDDDQAENLFQKLKSPEHYPALGRHEDLLRIDSVNMVNITEETIDSDFLKMPFYIPLSAFEQEERESISGTLYDLTKDYILVNVGKGKIIRKWNNIIEALYTSASVPEFNIFSAEGYVDSEGDYAFFA